MTLTEHLGELTSTKIIRVDDNAIIIVKRDELEVVAHTG